ncbi:unnamed protein product, partial [Prorocentrum cordatum]
AERPRACAGWRPPAAEPARDGGGAPPEDDPPLGGCRFGGWRCARRPPAAPSMSAQPPTDRGPEEWLVQYVAELGHGPRSAEHLRAFAANRGGSLSYAVARQALAEAHGAGARRDHRRSQEAPP